MKFLIELKYQKWLLVVPMLTFLAACINYLYNTRILRMIEIMFVYLVVSSFIFIIASFVIETLEMESYYNTVMIAIYYLLSTPASLLVIKLQQKDFELG